MINDLKSVPEFRAVKVKPSANAYSGKDGSRAGYSGGRGRGRNPQY